jgi:hypothetical protein
MEDKEFILCAAIKWGDVIVSGYRHRDCYKTLDALKSDIPEETYPGREDQGFLTSKNRYVDRKEGWKIAKENNQIKFGKEFSDNGDDSELISENLYKEDE